MTLQEIDPKYLKSCQYKFMRLSEHRLARMLDTFNMEQADCIRLIPMLFHVNHPMLPGYVNKQTPCGIPNYFPSELEKKIAKTVSRSFEFKQRAYRQFDISALYLMGSTGTLAQSTRSDLDLWVCLASKLPESSKSALKKKTLLINQWMLKKSIELNCYLVQQDEFKINREKELEADSCGNTQNYLLLDEFYRTAVWVAGRMPIWWLVPPKENYNQFVKRLFGDKHLDSIEWIDLGGITEIPASEYFSAALWQLLKSIKYPYKSLVKLLLLEIYARCFPRVDLISARYKQLVYDDCKDLDPYLIVLLYAEDFLENNPQRLEFLRRAFYLKAGSKIQLNKNKPKNWRYQQLKKLVERWGWTQTRLTYLNNRNSWKISAVMKERADLVREINHSYHFLSNFGRVQGVLDGENQKDLTSIGRMLYAAFERRSGKIETINYGIVGDLTESAITIVEKSEQNEKWQLMPGLINAAKIAIHQIVYTAESFFEVLVWGVCNEIITSQTNIKVYSENIYYTGETARLLVKDLLPLTKQSKPNFSGKTFDHPAQTIMMSIYLNTRSDPLESEKASGIYSITNQKDAFCWGNEQLNLFMQFDVVWLNSWGEYNCKSYAGALACIHFFIEHNKELFDKSCELQFYGALPNFKQHKERLLRLFEAWNKLLIKSTHLSKTFRFMMSIGKCYLRIDFSQGKANTKIFKHAKALLMSLSDQVSGELSYVLEENLILPTEIIKIIHKARTDKHHCYFLEAVK